MHVNPKHKWCMKKKFGQKHRNWKFFNCNRSRIDQTSIENRSNINRVKQTQTKNFNRNFDWSKNRFDWSKFWKNQIFEKHNILMQKLLKAHYFFFFIKKRHKYEMKSFWKTLEFNLDLPKSRFSVNLSSKCKH